jgi:hypothetical protein
VKKWQRLRTAEENKMNEDSQKFVREVVEGKKEEAKKSLIKILKKKIISKLREE